MTDREQALLEEREEMRKTKRELQSAWENASAVVDGLMNRIAEVQAERDRLREALKIAGEDIENDDISGAWLTIQDALNKAAAPSATDVATPRVTQQPGGGAAGDCEEPRGCPTPGACSALAELAALRAVAEVAGRVKRKWDISPGLRYKASESMLTIVQDMKSLGGALDALEETRKDD